MTAVTPLVETNEGHQGTLLLRATRIKQESITSCITDNVSPKNPIYTANNSCWRGSIQISPTWPGVPKADTACEKHHSEPLPSFPCQTSNVRRQPLPRLYLKPQSWQKDKLQTKMPHLQEKFLQLLKILKQGKQSQRDQLQSVSSTQNFSAVLSTCHNSLHSCEKYCENLLRVKIERKRKGHREQEGQKDIKMCISLLSYKVLSQVQVW